MIASARIETTHNNALARTDLTAAAKALLKVLFADLGFREGWGIQDSKWTDSDHESLRQLDHAGIVTYRSGSAFLR